VGPIIAILPRPATGSAAAASTMFTFAASCCSSTLVRWNIFNNPGTCAIDESKERVYKTNAVNLPVADDVTSVPRSPVAASPCNIECFVQPPA